MIKLYIALGLIQPHFNLLWVVSQKLEQRLELKQSKRTLVIYAQFQAASF